MSGPRCAFCDAGVPLYQRPLAAPPVDAVPGRDVQPVALTMPRNPGTLNPRAPQVAVGKVMACEAHRATVFGIVAVERAGQ